MKDSTSPKNNKLHSHNSSTLFNQQSTNSLLKQLELSLYDVQEIIKKSKESLGLKQKSPRQLTHSRTRDFSQINFNMSIAQSSLEQQLTYSVSPETQSRVHTQQNQNNNTRNSRNIIRKIIFEQKSSKQNQQQNQKQKLRSKSDYLLKTSPQTLNNIQQKQLQNKYDKQNINQISPIQNQQSLQDQKQYAYDQQYNIIINKRQKQKLDKIQQISQNSDVSYFNQPNQINKQKYFIKNGISSNKITQINNQSPLKIQQSSIKSDSRYKTQFQQNTKKTTGRERVKIFKDSYKTNSWRKTKEYDNQKSKEKNKQKYSMDIIRQQMENTCVKNQLQNILLKNSIQKRIGLQQNDQRNKNLNKLRNQFAKMKQRMNQIRKFSSQQDKIKEQYFKNHLNQFMKEKSKSNSKSPSKPISPKKQHTLTKFSPIKSSQKTPIKKQQFSIKNNSITNSPTYIQKYLNILQLKQVPKGENKSKQKNKNSVQNKKNVYSHPSKSPDKKKPAVLQIQEHLRNNYPESSRSEFIQKMLQQCYVRRFLTKPQLSVIYDEFQKKKVPSFQWQEKVIEKIFNKIHHVDDLI